jgi:hypothetical protein
MEKEERWLNGKGGEVAQWLKRRGGSMVKEERWLNGKGGEVAQW